LLRFAIRFLILLKWTISLKEKSTSQGTLNFLQTQIDNIMSNLAGPDGGPLGRGLGGPRNVNINPRDLDKLECEECENGFFVEAVQLFELSKLQSPNGEEGLIPIQTFACSKCGHVNEELAPDVG
jgi:hypothetical protein